ncbi:MAG: hypothetical protein WEE89_04900 [Gemmatimonadota bacterium]
MRKRLLCVSVVLLAGCFSDPVEPQPVCHTAIMRNAAGDSVGIIKACMTVSRG